MELFHIRIFQAQLLDQCRFTLMSAQMLNTALNDQNIDNIWYSIQNFLSSSANISKMLWGQGGRLTTQRKALRDSIGINDESPLYYVSMRNNFEHMDERIDRWWNKSENHIFADRNIGRVTAINVHDPINNFRMFNPETTEITFWGEKFNVQQIVDEINIILPKLELEAEKIYWQE